MAANRLAEPEPWTRVAAVLAEVEGVDESRSFDAQARALAKTMRGVRFDWADRPCITWSTAAELLASLKAERARVLAAHEERVIAAAAAHLAAIPKGIPVDALPPGVNGGLVMMAADPMGAARRESPLEHALAHRDGAVYHPLPRDEQANK
jgi:hypothetical protein